MRIFIPRIPWIGNFHQYFQRAFTANQIQVGTNSMEFHLNRFIHTLKLHHITQVKHFELQYLLRKYNTSVLEDCLRFKPDVFLVFNESNLSPDTIKAIQEKCNCRMVCVLGDDPWDSIRYIADFPHSLKYFDIIFNPEPTWNINIRKVAPNALIYWHYAGFDPDVFHPIDIAELGKEDTERFSCDISFTGSSYGTKAEGAYRSDILSYLTDFDLKIWGDDNWQYRFKYLPGLRQSYMGSRLSYEDLRKLYTLSKVNLNLPAPQLVTCFQPRVFEIAATKGFQIVDNRRMLKKLFSDGEIVTFDSIPELREKMQYYLEHEAERIEITENLYTKVQEKYTWTKWANHIIEIIEKPKNFEQLDDIFCNQNFS